MHPVLNIANHGRDGILTINGDAGKRGNEDLELHLIGHLLGKFRIQAVNAFNHHDGFLVQLDGLASPEFGAIGKIKCWQFHECLVRNRRRRAPAH